MQVTTVTTITTTRGKITFYSNPAAKYDKFTKQDLRFEYPRVQSYKNEDSFNKAILRAKKQYDYISSNEQKIK